MVRSDLDASERPMEDVDGRIGTRLDGLVLERVLGRGGMGTVYAAAMERPHRTVAVKVLRQELESSSVRRRFEVEAEILARLRHPAIAQVLGAGLLREDGRQLPYYVLELIEGARHLVAWAQERSLPLAERVRVFLTVCDAVQHAHDKGVIHRDLKPGNILVDRDDHPKLIDFGVARVGDAEAEWRTRTEDRGQLLGTLPYIAPELLTEEEEADVLSDVYGLGVCLYELLCGRQPFDTSGLSLAAAIQRLLHEEPRPAPELPTELRWVLADTLTRDRRRRYPSARRLRADLERWLVGDPVEAAPPSAAYRLRKLARRHRVAVTAAAGLLLALVTGLVLSLVGLRREQALRHESEDNRRRSEVASEFLLDTFRRIDPDLDGLDLTVADLLDRSAPDLGTRFAGHPLLEASVRGHFAEAYQKLGRLDDAVEAYRTQIDLLESDPEPARVEAAVARRNLANALLQTGRIDAAEEHAHRALAVLCAELPEDAIEITAALQVLAGVEHERGNFAEALAQHRDVLTRYRALGPEWSREAATAQNMLAALLASAGELEQAIEVGRDAERRWRELDGPDSSHALVVGNVVAYANRRLGRDGEAVELYRANLDGRRRAFGADHVKTLLVASNLASLLLDLERFDEAEALLREALTTARRLEVVPSGLLAPFLNYGWLLYRTERSEEAARLFGEYLEHGGRTWPGGHWRLGEGHRALGTALFDLGDDEGAERELLRAHGILVAAFGEADPRTQRIARNLAKLYEILERPEEERAWRARTEGAEGG